MLFPRFLLVFSLFLGLSQVASRPASAAGFGRVHGGVTEEGKGKKGDPPRPRPKPGPRDGGDGDGN